MSDENQYFGNDSESNQNTNSEDDHSSPYGIPSTSSTPQLIIPEEEEEISIKVEKRNEYQSGLLCFKDFVPDIEIKESINDSLEFSISSTLLPLTIRVAYEFIDSDTLFNIKLELNEYEWTKKPNLLEITNPTSQNYYGKLLVDTAVNKFFSSSFRPKSNYRSAALILRSQHEANKTIVKEIEDAGYSYPQALRAASLCDNDYVKSVTFLQTGQYNQKKPIEILVDHRQCPLLFFVLEILDAILDLQDHCIMCGKPTTLGLKPGVCNNPLCLHQFINMGIGVSLVNEIKRDPYVADFLFSIFSVASQNKKYLNPRPPEEITFVEIQNVIKEMPPMKKICLCNNDNDLLNKIGKKKMDILKWVILTCRSNFLLLDQNLEIPRFISKDKDKKCFQFMALTASPEQENIFQQMKKVHGSRYLWHGSSIDRWHAIVHQGLKNMTGTEYQKNGSACGPGIYFAHDSMTSLSYATVGTNLYNNSLINGNLQIIALCEVINLPINKVTVFQAEVQKGPNLNEIITLTGGLYDHNWCMTLTMNEASIVRFIFINLDVNENVKTNPLKNIPTLNQVLRTRAKLKPI